MEKQALVVEAMKKMEEERAARGRHREEEQQKAKKKAEDEVEERVRREVEKAKAEWSGRGVSDAGAIAKPWWTPAAGNAAAGVGKAGQKGATASGISDAGAIAKPSSMPAAGDAGDRFGVVRADVHKYGSRTASGVGAAGTQKQANASGVGAAGDRLVQYQSRIASGVGRAGKQKQATASGAGEAVEPNSSVGDVPEPSPSPNAKPPPAPPPAESLISVPGLPGPEEQRGWLNGWDTCYSNYGPGGICTGIENYERQRAKLKKASLFKEYQAGLRDPSR